MRILHVVEAFGGGVLQMVVAVAEGSVARGHETLIAYGTRPETPATLREEIDDAVELRALPWTRRTPDAQLRAARALRALVAEWDPDVVHLHSSFAGALGALVAGRRAPTVFTPNAFASSLPEMGRLSRPVYRAAERFACRRATVVGAVSTSEATIARELGARRVVRVPNGIRELDPGRALTRAPEPSTPGPARVVAIGRTVPQRQPEATARILAAVRDGAEVEWLGGGGGRRGVAGSAALAKAGIRQTGWLPRAEVLERLGRATVYLHWTAWDGLPLSILEALALDVLVVASDIAPNREVLGDAGVCPSESAAIELIGRLISDAPAAEQTRLEQRARRDEFGAERMISAWHAVYDELVSSTRV